MKKKILVLLLTVVMIIGMVPTAFAGTETPPVNPTAATIKGVSLVLDGEIGLVFHFSAPSKYSSGYVKLYMSDSSEPLIKKISNCKPLDDDHLYTVTYNLSAVKLSEEVHITVFDVNDQQLSPDIAYSVEEYVKTLLQGQTATDKEKEIARTLVNYGHYAQIACAKANGWEIGKDCTQTNAIDELKVDSSVFKNREYSIEMLTEDEGISNFFIALNLDYKTEIKFTVPSQTAPTVTVNGEVTEAVPSKQFPGYYEISIDGINALNLEEKHIVKIGGTQIHLCAFSYCKLAVEQGAPQTTVDAMRALYEFYKAIENYFKS